jgi:hypothetical protein
MRARRRISPSDGSPWSAQDNFRVGSGDPFVENAAKTVNCHARDSEAIGPPIRQRTTTIIPHLTEWHFPQLPEGVNAQDMITGTETGKPGLRAGIVTGVC